MRSWNTAGRFYATTTINNKFIKKYNTTTQKQKHQETQNNKDSTSWQREVAIQLDRLSCDRVDRRVHEHLKAARI